MITIEQMVQREVLCCMSSLISTLAKGSVSELNNKRATYSLADLVEQASELVAPILDYEEAATQMEWIKCREGSWVNSEIGNAAYANARTLCEFESIDPYEWEVYEHWSVSQWLADKLAEQGEKVDTDFADLCIWARTHTGQAISMDGCIRRIYNAMMAPLDSVAPGA